MTSEIRLSSGCWPVDICGMIVDVQIQRGSVRKKCDAERQKEEEKIFWS